MNKTGMPSAATVEERFWWEAVVDFAGVFSGHSALVELPEYPLVPLLYVHLSDPSSVRFSV